MKERLQRVPFTRPVHIQWDGETTRARRMLAGNMSHGGMFVRSDAVVPPGTRVSVALEARGRPLAFAEAEVIWSADPSAPPQPGRLPGFGVRFLRFLNPRAPALLDFLVRRKPAHAAAQLNPQPINAPAKAAGPAPEARPPEDFMHTPIDDLGAAENTSSPKWTLDLDASDETPLSDATEEPSHPTTPEGGWFQNPEPQRASALDAADSGARMGTAAVLVAFLVIVAIGLLWVIRRDVSDEPKDRSAVAEAVAVNGAAAAPSRTHEILLAPPTPAQEIANGEGAPDDTDAIEVERAAPTSQRAEVAAAEPAGASLARAATPGEERAAAPAAERAAPTRTDMPAAERTATPSARAEAAAAALTSAPARPMATAPAAEAANPRRANATPATGTTLSLHAGAIDAVSISRSGSALTARLDLAAGASVDRVFVLSNPSRAVIDLAGAAPKASVKTASTAPVVTGVRVGARGGGTRVVLDLSAPASAATLTDGAVRIDLK